VVARPTKWGNPFTREAVINWHLGEYMEDRNAIWREEAVALFHHWATKAYPQGYFAHPACSPYSVSDCNLDFSELRGKDLACWCPLDQPCHADVLLRIANE
jgi:hypothetical protein